MTNSATLLPGVPLVESPLFESAVANIDFTAEELNIAQHLNRRGYAVIDFPDPEFDERVERIRSNLASRFNADMLNPGADKSPGLHRVQDAWKFDADVKALATNADMLSLLSRLYGRRAFPFQTLNFPVGTQQRLHSDSVHFSSQPERFMCGVWVAMEDIHADAGPLTYAPGSHRWPLLTNALVGRRGWRSISDSAQAPFEKVWERMIDAEGAKSETFLARKGQALIWCANLLHGGSLQTDTTRTRWSQVTHYYFENCLYYTPAYSDEVLGQLDLRTVVNIATGEVEPNLYLGSNVTPASAEIEGGRRKSIWSRWRKQRSKTNPDLPSDFDGESYLKINTDVAAAGMDPITHYLKHGRVEGRRYRLG